MSASRAAALTSPQGSIAHAAAVACFEQLCADSSVHGAVLPAALEVRAASDLLDPEQVEAAKSLVNLVVQTAHESPLDEPLIAGIAALARAALTVDATLDAADPARARALRRLLLPVLEGCLLSANMLLVREEGGEVGGDPDDLLEVALEVALHAPSLEVAAAR